jgi:hypothetical protein
MTLNNYKLCTLCDKTISLSNWSHHIKTKSIKHDQKRISKTYHNICSKCNLSLSKQNLFEDKWNKYGLSSYCKLCRNDYRRELVICENCQTSHTRNSYYKHLKSKKHLSVANEKIVPIGKICSKCKIDKPFGYFHNDKYKEDGKKSICKECRKVSK